jgi:hypothetical protein
VVLLLRKVTPPSGGHIGRTASPFAAEGVVRSMEEIPGEVPNVARDRNMRTCGRIE